ncbi:CG2059 [Drosophila busckii]|uniref:sn-1-specific diacylglycerol lipase ABHD11 n=1 Tax=Drosophila busckii TaxID=30019 RepID=A0A0M5J5T9_DROBS|nr:protein ABHD11 [Drosophila busckii]ALC48398.1 CG2059 [Drosophila busckii]
MQQFYGKLPNRQLYNAVQKSMQLCLPHNLRHGTVIQQQQQRQFAQSGAIQMAFDKFEGSNVDTGLTPVITMHGMFGSKQNWRGLSRALTQKTKRSIYAVDARNHGASPHTTVHDTKHMSADILHLMKENSISKTCIMGHSMGGRTAMHFALSYPELTERLIVLDISPVSIPKDFSEMTDIFDAMLNIDVSPDLPLSEGRKQVKEQLSKRIHKETVDFIMLNLRKHPETGAFSWACNVELLRNSLTGFGHYESVIKNLKPYKGPTTFICGIRSKYMTPDEWPQVKQFFPNATLHWLYTGHLVHVEAPEEFLGLVTNFLNE